MTGLVIESTITEINEAPTANVFSSFAYRWWNRFMFLEVILYFTPEALIGALQNEFLFLTYHPYKYLAELIFGFNSPVAIESADDSPFAYFHLIASLIIFAIIALIWAFIHGNRKALHKNPRIEKTSSWLWRNVLRIDLALLMISYGMVKTIPSQMHTPWPSELAQPLGNQNGMEYLWHLMGFSPAFEITVGILELLGGILLLTPRFTTLGGYLSLTIMIPTEIMDFCYDVSVKLLPSLICLGEIILLWPALVGFARHLIFQKDLTAKSSQTIITVQKPGLRFTIICCYIVLSVLSIIYMGKTTWKFYQSEQLDPSIPLNGRWIVLSVQSQDPNLGPLQPKSWGAFDITVLKTPSKIISFYIEYTAFSQAILPELFGTIYNSQEIILPTKSWEIMPYNLHLHYSLVDQILTLSSHDPRTHRQNLLIRAKRALPWPHHPGEFHWY